MSPDRAVVVAARVSRRLAAGARSASRSSPYGRAGGPRPTRPATIGGRTARNPGDRGGSRSGSWLRPYGPSGCPSWRRPSAARLRARLDTRGFELRNLRLLEPTGQLPVLPRVSPALETRLENYKSSSSVSNG